MHTMKATSQQMAILEFIQKFQEREGVSPSQREIQEHFGFASRHSVPKHLAALEKKALLERPTRRARSINVKSDPLASLLRIPLLGMIPAGYPSDQQEETDRCIMIDPDTIQIPRTLKTFALQVRGDSMVDAAIVEGDIVIMELCEPRHRDIVAALIDGETTLKRYLVEGGRPFLRAENPNYPDLIPARELVIQGVFRALIRTAKSRF